MTLSAVITIHFNAFHERRENLYSQLSLAPPHLRIVLVADGFNLETRKELSTYIGQMRQKNVQLIFGVFGNPGDARNAGIACVDSDWVCFWDSDDCPAPDKFLDLMREAKEANTDIAKGSYQTRNNFGDFRSIEDALLVEPNEFYRHILDPGIWRYIFSRRIYESICFPGLRIGEDQNFIVQAFLMKPKLYCSSEIVYTYSIGNSDQITQNIEAFKDVWHSLEYLSNLRGLTRKSDSANLIILTAYFKQLFTGLKRAGWSGSNLNFRQIFKDIFIVASHRDILRVLKTLVVWRLRK